MTNINDTDQTLNSDAEFLLELGLAFEENGDFKKAVKEYKKAIRLVPDWPEAYNAMGIALEGMERLGKAVDAYLEALRLDPEFVGAKENLIKSITEHTEKRLKLSSASSMLKSRVSPATETEF